MPRARASKPSSSSASSLQNSRVLKLNNRTEKKKEISTPTKKKDRKSKKKQQEFSKGDVKEDSTPKDEKKERKLLKRMIIPLQRIRNPKKSLDDSITVPRDRKVDFFKYMVTALGISLSPASTCDAIQETSIFKNCKDILKALSNENLSFSVDTLKKLAKELNVPYQRCRMLILVSRALHPKQFVPVFSSTPPEMSLCGPLFDPLFDFCALFENCNRNRYVSNENHHPWS
ncbi:hypothetical protein FDP41_006017 [Naegleria fowleri]|uniref:Uncharacterized protein n=1 Tax=Naegleria fowleri TaxID=5763 RepID=A0A6A5BP00_NAEFO|nr:uncharacterized protein FDP41_006017 [Naegleria fowleri]KAF0975265.1 hypothetical protein FDP41_006017 [Naegleria fowleri]